MLINIGVASCVVGLSVIGLRTIATRRYALRTLLATMALVAVFCGLLVAARRFQPPSVEDVFQSFAHSDVSR